MEGVRAGLLWVGCSLQSKKWDIGLEIPLKRGSRPKKTQSDRQNRGVSGRRPISLLAATESHRRLL